MRNYKSRVTLDRSSPKRGDRFIGVIIMQRVIRNGKLPVKSHDFGIAATMPVYRRHRFAALSGVSPVPVVLSQRGIISRVTSSRLKEARPPRSSKFNCSLPYSARISLLVIETLVCRENAAAKRNRNLQIRKRINIQKIEIVR